MSHAPSPFIPSVTVADNAFTKAGFATALAATVVFSCSLTTGCGTGGGPPKIDPTSRTGVIIEVLTRGDANILHQRPALAAGKYELMAANAFAFFRGSLALFLNDWNDPARELRSTRFPAGGAQPFGMGDAHPENFGTMRSAAGTFRLEPNDFDTADLLPYLWDVRRFSVGMCLASRLTNPTDPAARAATATGASSVVRASVTAYAEALRGLAAGAARPAIEAGSGNVILDDLFARSTEDWEQGVDLDRITEVDDFRKLVRGALDPARPEERTRDLPARAHLAIAATLAAYRGSLVAPPPISELVPLDAVQEFGQGIGSFPRLRALVLVRGPTTGKGDDAVLEMKELPPQDASPLPVRSAFASPEQRILAALGAGWTERAADPRWGVGQWLGSPVQLRTDAAGFKTVRVNRLEGELGTADAVLGLGATLARLVARMHAAPLPDGQLPSGAIAAEIARDPSGFVEEQASVAMAYCDQVLSDWALFRQARAQLGPTLGIAGDATNAATPDLRLLFAPQSDPAAAGVNPVVGAIAFNEVMATGAEFVELTNTSSELQDVSTLRLADSDEDGGPKFGEATALAGAAVRGGEKLVVAGGYVAPLPGRQSDCPVGISSCYQASWDVAGSKGESLYLLSAGDVILDRVWYPEDGAPAGQSWGRLPDGQGPFAVGRPSPGAVNAPPP